MSRWFTARAGRPDGLLALNFEAVRWEHGPLFVDNALGELPAVGAALAAGGAAAAGAGTLATIASVASIVGGVASVANALKKPKASGSAATEAPPVTPLPDAQGAAVKLRVAQSRLAASKRSGLGSTLIGGQLGDTRAPAVAPPLVLGRV